MISDLSILKPDKALSPESMGEFELNMSRIELEYVDTLSPKKRSKYYKELFKKHEEDRKVDKICKAIENTKCNNHDTNNSNNLGVSTAIIAGMFGSMVGLTFN